MQRTSAGNPQWKDTRGLLFSLNFPASLLNASGGSPDGTSGLTVDSIRSPALSAPGSNKGHPWAAEGDGGGVEAQSGWCCGILRETPQVPPGLTYSTKRSSSQGLYSSSTSWEYSSICLWGGRPPSRSAAATGPPTSARSSVRPLHGPPPDSPEEQPQPPAPKPGETDDGKGTNGAWSPTPGVQGQCRPRVVSGKWRSFLNAHQTGMMVMLLFILPLIPHETTRVTNC